MDSDSSDPGRASAHSVGHAVCHRFTILFVQFVDMSGHLCAGKVSAKNISVKAQPIRADSILVYTMHAPAFRVQGAAQLARQVVSPPETDRT